MAGNRVSDMHTQWRHDIAPNIIYIMGASRDVGLEINVEKTKYIRLAANLIHEKH
jgi:hypothetical protein